MIDTFVCRATWARPSIETRLQAFQRLLVGSDLRPALAALKEAIDA